MYSGEMQLFADNICANFDASDVLTHGQQSIRIFSKDTEHQYRPVAITGDRLVARSRDELREKIIKVAKLRGLRPVSNRVYFAGRAAYMECR